MLKPNGNWFFPESSKPKNKTMKTTILMILLALTSLSSPAKASPVTITNQAAMRERALATDLVALQQSERKLNRETEKLRVESNQIHTWLMVLTGFNILLLLAIWFRVSAYITSQRASYSVSTLEPRQKQTVRPVSDQEAGI
jgi:hypothetical protein